MGNWIAAERADAGICKRRISRRDVMLGASTLAVALSSGRAKADFAPRTLRIIIGHAPGGGNDRLMRLVVKHLAPLLPSTGITVENDPRGGGKLAAKTLTESKGGEPAIAMLSSSLIYVSLREDQDSVFDLLNLNYVANFTRSQRVLAVSAKSGVRSMRELIEKRSSLIAPASTASSNTYLEPLLINAIAGAHLKPVPGYEGGARNLALISGEGQALVGSRDSIQPVLDLPGSRIILRLNDFPFNQDGATPPLLAEFARSETATLVAKVIAAGADLGGLVALPPDADPAAVEAMRDLLARVAASSEFLAEAEAQKMLIDPMPADEIGHAMQAIFGDKVVTAAAIKSALGCGEQLAAGADRCG
jgi:hypothetical protein